MLCLSALRELLGASEANSGIAQNAVLLEHNAAHSYFKFLALKPGTDTIVFSFAHEETLTSVTGELEVTVTGA
jgi:hypothetical protein